jgi:hypothetical protein
MANEADAERDRLHINVEQEPDFVYKEYVVRDVYHSLPSSCTILMTHDLCRHVLGPGCGDSEWSPQRRP